MIVYVIMAIIVGLLIANLFHSVKQKKEIDLILQNYNIVAALLKDLSVVLKIKDDASSNPIQIKRAAINK